MDIKRVERIKFITNLYLNEGIDIKNNSFELIGEITEESHIKTKRALKFLDLSKKIILYLNSEGGNLHDGLAVYDLLNGLNLEIIVEGSAMSMGALILMSGKKRLCTENSTIMFHYGLSVDESESSAKVTKMLHEKIKKITKERCNTTTRKVNNWFKQDTYLLSDMCLKENVIDEIYYVQK